MDSNQKLKYEKSKYIVKKWESDFKKMTNSLPSKADIKCAPSKIKEAYKTYWSLKQLSLKKTLSDINLDENAKDCFNSSSENAEENQLISPKNVLNNSKCEVSTEDSICFQPLSETLNDSQFLVSPVNNDSASFSTNDLVNISDNSISFPQEIKEKSNDLTPISFKNLFVNKNIEPPVEEKERNEKNEVRKLEAKSLSCQYAGKLFAGSKFNKRNPRKPRNFSRSKTVDSINTKLTTDSQQSHEEPNSKLDDSSLFQGLVKPKELELKNHSENKSFIDDFQDESALLLNEKFKIANREVSFQSQAVSLLQKAFDSSESSKIQKLSISRAIDKGWLDRLEESHSIPDKKVESPIAESQDSGISSLKSDSVTDSILMNSTLECTNQKANDDSSSDLIYDSDCESQSQSFCRLNLLDTLSRSSVNENSFCKNENSVNCFAVKPKENIFEQPSGTVKHTECEELLLKNNVTNDRKRLLFDSLDNEPLSKRPKTINSDLNEYNFTSSTKPELILPFESIKKKKNTGTRNTETSSKKMELLEKKMASGSANENFVKINIEKKRYVRGKKQMNFSKYKKQKWKEAKKKSGFESSGGVLKCFKCGDVGHFSKACPNKKDGLLPLEDYDSSEESPFPTLEEAAEMAKEAADKAHRGGRKFTKDENSELAELEPEDPSLRLGSVIKPIYEPNPDGSIIDTPNEVYEALRELGHNSFRPGQEEGVMRILSGVSTLVTLSTGSGKSLIYQLPAYMYNKKNPGCITLVISPLVSLMEDQVYCGSKKLHAACLHHNMTQKKREAVIESLKSQTISVLLIAPESLSSWDSARSLFKILPPIAFACIDEAHSISQFSHNFRPSYLTICQVLREKLGISTLLGLTATASRATLNTIMSQLSITDDSSVITDTPLPDNLFLSVSSEENRKEALLTLLHSNRFKDCDSIIVYCTRREECDAVAGFLRVALQETGAPNKKGRLSLHAEAYHAGLTAGRRNQVQSAFMTGKLRIVVATVAFGMGINKNDIRGIIHFNMPYSFESYVQEIGRAGRDRKPAHCHLFLDSKRNDLCELQRHIYADTMDRHILRKLLQLVFVPCDCNKKMHSTTDNNDKEKVDSTSGVCSHHEVAFSIENTVKALDLPQEVISTLLAYLQLDEKRWIKVLPLAYTKCKITSYKGARHLKNMAKTCPPLAVVMAELSTQNTATLEFDIIQLSRRINWDSGTVKHTLKQLEWTTLNDHPRKTGILVEFTCLGFRVLSPGNLDDTHLDEALDLLHSKVIGQEESRLKQLSLFYDSLKRVAHSNVAECCDDVNMEQCNGLKSEVRKYFTEKEPLALARILQCEITDEFEVISDIRRLISLHRSDASFTGRAIARILHGIGSPNFPPIVWGRTKFWRLHLDKDFNSLVRLANKQLILMR